jgi:hypothetical protein
MSANTFTQEQILSGLRIFLREDYGCESPFDPDSRIDEYFMVERIWEELDTGELAKELSKFFGFACSLDEWEEFFGWSANARDGDGWELLFAPHFTFRGLADFIRERVEPISLEPITLLGKPCRTAGIFRALERLAGQVHPKVRRFAPSTPIRARLHGSRLHKFWDRLRWITRDQIPIPYRIKFGCGGFYLKIAIGLLIALWKRDLEGLWLSLKVTALLFLPTAFLVEFLNSQLNPLPKEIKTFGDLARYLAVVTENRQPQGA